MEKLNNSTYTLGLDIGIDSIGWALLDFKNEKIVRIGTRKFQEPFDRESKLLSITKRHHRYIRRTIRRRLNRRKRLMNELCKQNIISEKQMRISLENKPVTSNIFYNTRKNPLISPWLLRAEGLERRLTKTEWARVLIHLSKHRGYQVDAIVKRREEGKLSEIGQLLEGISNMQKKLKKLIRANPEKPHSIGEMIYREFPHRKRNTTNIQSFTIGREDLLEELEILFDQQKKLGNPHTQDDFRKRIREIINSGRRMSQGPGKPSPYGENLIERTVGRCSLDPSQERAPKYSYTAAMFRFYQVLNTVRWGSNAHQHNTLSPEQKQGILDRCQNITKLSYAHIRDMIGLEKGKYFRGVIYQMSYAQIRKFICKTKDKNYYESHIKGKNDVIPRISALINWETPGTPEEKVKRLEEEFCMPLETAETLVRVSSNPESRLLFDFTAVRRLEKALKLHQQEYTTEDLDEIARILSIYRDEEACEKLQEYKYSYAVSEELALSSLSEFDSLSIATMKKLNPYLRDGKSYEEACKEAGFEHSLSLVDPNSIRTPSVFRAFKQLQQLMYALVREYGLPSKICVEVSKTLSQSKKERRRLQSVASNNEKIKTQLIDEFKDFIGREPMGREAQVWKFYHEQDGKCLYSGEDLGDLKSIFAKEGTPTIEVEHSIPYSRSLDNRQCNKTVTSTRCSQEKGHRTPFEYFGSDENGKAWKEFKNRCSIIRDRDRKKYDALLSTDWDEGSASQWLLNDTRYITQVVLNWLESDEKFQGYFVANPKKNQERNVYTIKNGATYEIRKVWRLERHKHNNKRIKGSGRNNALSAAVTAATTSRFIQMVSQMNQRNKAGEKTKVKEQGMSKKIHDIIPEPWKNFSRELLALYGQRDGEESCNHDPNESMALIPGAAKKYGIDNMNKPLKPLLVSWRPDRKVKGKIHKETINSIEHIAKSKGKEKEECYFKRIPLTELTYERLENMAGAFDSYTGNPTPMYTRLKARLDAFKGNAKKAFKKEIRKGKKPNAPVIRKVRVKEVMGGIIPIHNGAAGNGTIVRVDIFRRKNKKGIFEYYLIPIYTKHRTYESMPLRSITRNRPESEWVLMKPEEFFCSLYSKDYVRIQKKGVLIEGYYVGTDRQAVRIEVHPADKKGKKEKNTINQRASLKADVISFTKYAVDVLGNMHVVRLPEHRVSFTRPGQKG